MKWVNFVFFFVYVGVCMCAGITVGPDLTEQ